VPKGRKHMEVKGRLKNLSELSERISALGELKKIFIGFLMRRIGN
jgi:hypothetical protein